MPDRTQDTVSRIASMNLTQVGKVGRYAVLASAVKSGAAPELIIRNLPTSICADGANGRTIGHKTLARLLDVQRPDGSYENVPLATYHIKDFGSQKTWQPLNRRPFGLDAPESGGARELVGWQPGPTADAPKVGVYRYHDCYGFVLDATGQPIIQGESDPAPGYLISRTALVNPRQKSASVDRYVDAAAVPYFVLPADDLAHLGVKLGDLALLIYRGCAIWVQAADSGNHGKLLEISIAAAIAHNIPPNARYGGAASGATIVIYPGSGQYMGWLPGTASTITAAGIELLMQLGV